MKTASRRPGSLGTAWTGPLYLDASALVKIYLPEPGSDELDAALTGRTDLMISDLGITEIISALARRRRDGNLRNEVASRLHGRILDDVEGGLYEVIPLVPSTHREAERLLLALEEKPLRAGDALHLAMTISAGARSLITFDQRLAEAARRIGIYAAVSS